jgi:hypothetical protein
MMKPPTAYSSEGMRRSKNRVSGYRQESQVYDQNINPNQGVF